MRILIATRNPDKLREIKEIAGPGFELVSLLDFSEKIDIHETGETAEENALIKAREGYRISGIPTLADDTVLEVYALEGRPGVHSARYSGGGYKDNVRKLLQEMKGVKDRRARFRTVVALVNGEEERLFEGVLEGEIIEEERGTYGFGYDPVFRPFGMDKTLAELLPEEKNRISHRFLAFSKAFEYLRRGVAQPG